MLGNELFWAHYIRGVFIEETRTLGQALKGRILKAFVNIEQEAEKLKGEEYKRLLQAPASKDGGPGMDVPAESAEDEAIDFYINSIFTKSTPNLLHFKQFLVIFFMAP